MRIDVEHFAGEDFGLLLVTLEDDDSCSLIFDGGEPGTALFKVPVHNDDAKALREALKPIANATSLR